MNIKNRTGTFIRVIAAAAAAVCLLGCLPAGRTFGNVYAEEDTDWMKAVNMGDFDVMDSVSGSAISGLDVLTEDGVSFLRVYLVPNGVDPFIYLPIGLITEGVKCSEYKYLAIRVRTLDEGFGNLYFGTSDDQGLNEEKNQRFSTEFAGNNDWCTAVVDFSTHYKWTGYVTTARFDPFGMVPEGNEYIDIAWFAFVKTAKDLEKLDGSLKDFGTAMSVTRMPVFATPDRTRPAGSDEIRETAGAAGGSGARGLPSGLLVIGSAVLIALIFLAVTAIIAGKRKNKQQN